MAIHKTEISTIMPETGVCIPRGRRTRNHFKRARNIASIIFTSFNEQHSLAGLGYSTDVSNIGKTLSIAEYNIDSIAINSLSRVTRAVIDCLILGVGK